MADTAKKVLFVITKSNWGGAQRYVYDLATSLPSPFTPTVILGGNGTLKDKLEQKHIRVISLPSLGRDVHILQDFLVFVRLLFLFRRERPAVVHLNSSKIGGLGSLAARLAGVPKIIFTAHGFAFNEDRSTLQKFLIKVSYWLTLLLAHKTIAVSQALADSASWPFVKNKITVVHNGIQMKEPLERDAARDILRELYPPLRALDEKSMWIGSVGELHPVKGFRYAIDAIMHLKNRYPLHYLILGDGDEREALLERIKSDSVENTVSLLGSVPDAAQYMRAFDILLVPSLSESFGYVILEAGLAGATVIASDVGGIPEILTDGKSGLLVPRGDSHALADRIEFVIHDHTLRSLLSKNLEHTVKEKFSRERMVKETVRLY